MATVLTLRMAGMFSLGLKAENAVVKDDGDTKVISVCVGGGIDPETELAILHDPLVPTCTVTCPTCKLQKSSWHGWAKGHDNGDGTFTLPDAEVIAAAAATEDLKKSPDLLLHPLADVEASTMANGRTYLLKLQKDKDAPYYMTVAQGVDALRAEGKVLVTRWAVSTAVATFQLVTIAGVLAFQELATPDMLKARPSVDFPAAPAANVEVFKMMANLTATPFDAATYENEQQKAVAAALKVGEARTAGATVGAPAAGVSPDQFFAGVRAALAAGDVVPQQALPSVVPANVDTSLVKAAPKKRAPRKVAEKIPA